MVGGREGTDPEFSSANGCMQTRLSPPSPDPFRLWGLAYLFFSVGRGTWLSPLNLTLVSDSGADQHLVTGHFRLHQGTGPYSLSPCHPPMQCSACIRISPFFFPFFIFLFFRWHFLFLPLGLVFRASFSVSASMLTRCCCFFGCFFMCRG
ncbi:hypothetical protein B0I35DRAFT_274038 [Stachybotrys elegans]|uniref:Uncharacterized protein n=1 Tax=Stachybotrys elegans TaxID=80388 RepID=A0A8K0WQ93_9HYPO|nr:hypothetical protein B0I35DRAFT_274038 [Stachybotrys elegans]